MTTRSTAAAAAAVANGTSTARRRKRSTSPPPPPPPPPPSHLPSPLGPNAFRAHVDFVEKPRQLLVLGGMMLVMTYLGYAHHSPTPE